MSLYFPELKDVHNDFVTAKNNFGEEYGQVIKGNFKAETSETKQLLCGKFLTLYKHIDDQSTTIQHRIQQLIKP